MLLRVAGVAFCLGLVAILATQTGSAQSGWTY